MRRLLIVLSLLLVPVAATRADVSVGLGIEMPGVSIGINMPAYPHLARVPGYPVYYAPRVDYNYFFFDGLYWVFMGDNWYVSSWYNGPWDYVEPAYVPAYLLCVPVRYYRRPPPYFHDWRRDAPPRWGQHWGPDWEQRHGGWDRRERRAPPPAPLPRYQRQFSGERYPQEPERQHSIRSERYRYQPREEVPRQYYERRGRGGDGERGRGPDNRGNGRR